jgi:hypothetical protein
MESMTGPSNEPDPHEFEFELDKAILDQVLKALESSPLMPLRKDLAPRNSGVYALYWRDTLVYIGKASKGTTRSKRTLRARLNEHVTKIEEMLSDRENLSLEDMQFKYLTIDSDWFVWAAEFALINYYRPDWNGSGYGSKVPGGGRPGTGRLSRFDQMFPRKGALPPAPEGMENEDEDGDEDSDTAELSGDIGGDDPGE